jgi:hypothetical protein
MLMRTHVCATRWFSGGAIFCPQKIPIAVLHAKHACDLAGSCIRLALFCFTGRGPYHRMSMPSDSYHFLRARHCLQFMNFSM